MSENTFNRILDWLRAAGYEVIIDDDEVRGFMHFSSKTLHFAKVEIPNSELGFRVHFENANESFDIKSSRYFGELDTKNFTYLPEERREKYYRRVINIMSQFDIDVRVIPERYEVHFSKTFTIADLNREYFLKSALDFIEGLKKVMIAYDELSRPDPL